MRSRNIFTTLAVIALFGMAAFAQSGKGTSIQQVRDVDQPAKQPFYKYLASAQNTLITTVPDGKVLVIEHVNGRMVTTTTGSGSLIVYTATPDGEIEMYNHFGPSFYSASENLIYFGQQTKLYVTAGKSAVLHFSGNGLPGIFGGSVSGYFVDVP